MTENVNDEPPLPTVNADAAAVELTTKSEAAATVVPLADEAIIVHIIVDDIRTGFVLMQLRVEAVVGRRYTAKRTDPPVITCEFVCTDILNAPVTEAGVAEKVNDAPPSPVAREVSVPEELRMEKSTAFPVVAPVFDETDTVHAATELSRKGMG